MDRPFTNTQPLGNSYQIHVQEGTTELPQLQTEQTTTGNEAGSIESTNLEYYNPYCSWVEIRTEDGLVYYYNHATTSSTWEMPEEYKQYLEMVNNYYNYESTSYENNSQNNIKNYNQTQQYTGYQNYAKPMQFTPNTEINKVFKPIQVSSKAEARKIFYELMKSKGVDANSTWEMAMEKIIDDPRYKVLSTLADRKQCYYEFIEDRKQEEAKLQKFKEEKMREEFLQLLKSCKEITVYCNYAKIEQILENEPQWYAISSQSERELLFESFLFDLKEQEKEKNIKTRLEVEEQFRELLENSKLNIHSQWRQVKQKLQNEPAYKQIDKVDRLRVFENYLQELERLELEKRRNQNDQMQLQFRTFRGKFRDLLSNAHAQGKLNCKTPWNVFGPTIKHEVAYQQMLQVPNTSPLDLYENYLEELYEMYAPIRLKLREIKKSIKFNFTNATTKEEFETEFSKHPDYSSISDEHKSVFFRESVEAVQKKLRKMEKKKAKNAKKYLNFLKKYFRSNKPESTVTWAELSPNIKTHKTYKKLADPATAEKLFNDNLQENLKLSSKKRKRKTEDSPTVNKKQKL